MSPSRPDILTARGAARPLKRLDAHLAAGTADAPGLREVPVAELWLRHQPRKLVPDSVLEALIAADRAQPAALLAELERLAAAEPTSTHAATLQGLHDLAATIRVHGVLVPIRLARMDDRYVVEEGHRRSLATLLAGQDRLPAVVAESASELLLAARQFVANDQRADLSALEKAAWLRDLMAKADRELRLRKDWPLEQPSFSTLFESADEDDGSQASTQHPASVDALPGGAAANADSSTISPNGTPPNGHADTRPNGTSANTRADADPSALPALGHAAAGALSPWERAGVRATPEAVPAEATASLAAARPPVTPTRADLEAHKGEVRSHVLSLTGLSLGRYYQLRQLNRLSPEARELAAGLTERHLRPVVVLPAESQALVVRAIVAHEVPANKVPALVRALADGGEAALRRALATLGLPSPRGRVASTFSRLPPVPPDWAERVQLVGQELRTIKAPHARRTRLAQLAEQAERLTAVAAAYRDLLRENGVEARTED
jgi:hypothetical protein